ncbi:MAG: VOC family protein [Phycisphaerales bacterium]
MKQFSFYSMRIVLCAAGLWLAGSGVWPHGLGERPAPRDAAVAGTAQRTGGVDAVASIGVTVSDLDRSVRFYTEVLGFTRESEAEVMGDNAERERGVFGVRARVARLRIGREAIELTQYLAPAGRPIPVDSRSNDGWFQHIAIVVSDMDAAYRRLRENGVRHASSGPQTLPRSNPNAGGIWAFYFKDPDDHVLEVIHFPSGKGDPRWQEPSGSLFLGIDHTAIVVGDTDASIAFYRDVLGMRVAGASENFGSEQEHLNNVFGARLRITALRADSGPGIELLEYLAPSDGRAFPRDTKACDLWHWEVRLTTPDIAGVERSTRAAHARWITAGAIDTTGDGAPDMMSVRDPDGHALVVENR